ncbi:MAG: hypothetical protein A2W61_07530 [Deltaproteobacteria bacterium RIFCSPLOWO2_01_44_7]|nr:MAG: hypothetical protein A2712_08650 [Deltaproteobacteria bacterium RIFCSPHIGHO2_01_FULL_43_49]OGQ14594.1 MAG: hypothetical protein A3D22_08350 [Deltaproteobacteria bacterium RIFCSPHIGHO2_02_FULL_44_53]OGQ27980.1 MAG: hypothetical protein A3D98_07060 [Deltaproteobacteria bacterium RIFCSPHIGHO2_12_FULL_44_21]OGQ31192.1 MAG: hypothetical protein A2979_07110 [Deltaproteobacteria bacterium RIFCSPLOWO2_01_FULL_45_74]OGQ37981.1 MAG: hypothetical protein A2W61_07530 [Deltaproteobacteria bacterium 
MKYKTLWLFIAIIFPQLAFAQSTQFYLEDRLNDKLKVRIYVAGEVSAKTQVQETLYKAVDHARETLNKLDVSNPSSELAKINQKKTAGNFTVSPELAKAIEVSLDVSRWTKGAFDITFDSKEGNFREIKVNSDSNELKIKIDNMTINLRHVTKGILADLIADDLGNAGFKNCLVKVGSVFVTRGNDVSGPWKIPVIAPSDKLAKKALLYKATDVSAATLTTNDGSIDVVDPRNKSRATSDLKSVTVFTQSGTKAEGLAAAVYVMGSNDGKKFLEKNSNLRGVLGDKEGNLTHIPEWKPNP